MQEQTLRQEKVQELFSPFNKISLFKFHSFCSVLQYYISFVPFIFACLIRRTRKKDQYLQTVKSELEVHVLNKKAKIISENNCTSRYSLHHTNRQQHHLLLVPYLNNQVSHICIYWCSLQQKCRLSPRYAPLDPLERSLNCSVVSQLCAKNTEANVLTMPSRNVSEMYSYCRKMKRSGKVTRLEVWQE